MSFIVVLIHFEQLEWVKYLPNISERVPAALEVSAVVLLQLTYASLFRLHLAEHGRWRGLLDLTGTARATLARFITFRLPSRGRNTYLHRRRAPKATLLPRTPRRRINGVRTTACALVGGC